MSSLSYDWLFFRGFMRMNISLINLLRPHNHTHNERHAYKSLYRKCFNSNINDCRFLFRQQGNDNSLVKPYRSSCRAQIEAKLRHSLDKTWFFLILNDSVVQPSAKLSYFPIRPLSIEMKCLCLVSVCFPQGGVSIDVGELKTKYNFWLPSNLKLTSFHFASDFHKYIHGNVMNSVIFWHTLFTCLMSKKFFLKISYSATFAHDFTMSSKKRRPLLFNLHSMDL